MKSYCIFAIFFSLLISITAQNYNFPKPVIEFKPKSFICYRSYTDMKIDGDLFDTPWLDTEWSDYFVDIEGQDKQEPYYKTRVKMLWDDIYFYFAAELEDEHIWAKLKKHDSVIYNDNDFEIFIDPDGHTHNYYELEINAFNTLWDLLLIKPYRDGEKVALTDWDMKGVKSGVKVYGSINDANDNDEKWTVEVAIPWSVFREMSHVDLPPKENDQWRVNFSRVQWETEIDNGKYIKERNIDNNKLLPEHNWVWSPQGIIAMHYPEMWGYVQFSYKVASYGKDEFIVNSDESIKWYLREVYYKQKEYYMNNGKYSNTLKFLGLAAMALDDENLVPEFIITKNSFDATINYNNKKYLIKTDGFVKIIDSTQKD